jgi:hypothetical protein
VHSCCFWLGVLVAEGLAVRNWDEEEGTIRYRADQFAPQEEQRPKVN